MTGEGLPPGMRALIDQHAAQLRDDTGGKSAPVTAADIAQLISDLFTGMATTFDEFCAANPDVVPTAADVVGLLRTEGAAFALLAEQLGGAS